MNGETPRLLPLPLAGIVLGLLLAVAAAVFMAASVAYAEVEGPCTASIAGSDIGLLDSGDPDDAISVDSDERIDTTMFSDAGFRSHEIKLGFGAGFPSQTVEEHEDSGETSFTETVDVADYATFGVGLYKVTGEAILTDNGFCKGAVLVKVTGRNPITTVAGGVATGVVVATTAGAAVTGVVAAVRLPGRLGDTQSMVEEAFREQGAREERPDLARAQDEAIRDADAAHRQADEQSRASRRRDRRAGNSIGVLIDIFGCMCFAALALVLTPLLALTRGAPGGGAPTAPVAAPAASAPRRVPRAMWLPRITLLGLLSGLLAGAAVTVLLQQFAVVYPTTGLLIALVAIGAVAYGIVVPTLGYTIGWLRVNRRVAALERRRGGGR